MDSNEKTNLLVNIARLYYEHNYSQQMIAEKLNLSRPYVSKLINEAKDKGIVEIKINDPYESETQLEMELREKFNLHKVIVVPTNNMETDILNKIGKTSARYLNGIIKSGDIISVGWGATLYAFSQNVIRRDDLQNITVVQLCGGISNIEKNIYATEIPKSIADAYRGTPYILPLPAVVDNVKVKGAILQDRNISSVLGIANKANIAIFTMGPFGYDGALYRVGYLNRKDVEELLVKGAVGDVCTHIINERGEICDETLNNRTIAVELNELKKKKYRIGIAIGPDRLKCISGALKAGYPNVLITDEATALALINMNK